MPEIRWATLPEDWPTLLELYRRVYPERHPLRNRAFCEWQYRTRGRALVAMEQGKAVGHLGLDLSGGMAWVINVWLSPEHRGTGLIEAMYEEAAGYGPPLAATNVNAAGHAMYRRMGWHRYHDLIRYVKQWGPMEPREVGVTAEPFAEADDNYWLQPGVTGTLTPLYAGVSQPRVGGLRLVRIHKPGAVETHARALGYTWCDYVTSWNDPLCRTLDKLGWRTDDPVPWLSDPLVPGSRCTVSLLSKDPLPADYIVSRADSDHGRVARLPEGAEEQ